MTWRRLSLPQPSRLVGTAPFYWTCRWPNPGGLGSIQISQLLFARHRGQNADQIHKGAFAHPCEQRTALLLEIAPTPACDRCLSVLEMPLQRPPALGAAPAAVVLARLKYSPLPQLAQGFAAHPQCSAGIRGADPGALTCCWGFHQLLVNWIVIGRGIADWLQTAGSMTRGASVHFLFRRTFCHGSQSVAPGSLPIAIRGSIDLVLSQSQGSSITAGFQRICLPLWPPWQ